MIKVLIAEDEIPLLRGLKRIIEKLNPEFQVVKSAYNGKDALEYLENNSVDVVFTDINMPLVNGIELLKYVNENHPDTVKIVISGYDDFSYATSAIKYGVMEYLLKPIVEEELKVLLGKIEDEYVESLKRKHKENLIDALYTDTEIPEKNESIQMLYLCAGPLMKAGMDESISDYDFWKGINIEEITEGILQEGSFVFGFEKHNANERILLLVNTETDIEKFAEELLKILSDKLYRISIAYCSDIIGTKDIVRISGRLRNLLKKNMLFDSNIITGDREINLPGERFSLGENMETDLAFLEFKNYITTAERLTQKNCQDAIYKILNNLGDNLNDNSWDRDIIDEMVSNLLLCSSGREELIDNVAELIEENNMEAGELTGDDLMRSVENYIKEHLAEEITVNSLSGEFGLVAPYLSKLFKEYSGYTISKYIQNLRLDKAKKLLLMDEDILAKDVARMVGYNNPLYFSKIFKKKVGVYPSEYRKK